MKITRISTIPVQIPINPVRAIKGSRGGHTVSPFLLVQIHTDEGITGLGEVSCTPIWSGEDQVTAAHFIDEILAPPHRARVAVALFRQELTDIVGGVVPLRGLLVGYPVA